MREIKYRCWHNNKIEKVHSIHLNSKKVIVSYPGGGNYSIPFDETILMEYIGRKDVNNVEIYEGILLNSLLMKYLVLLDMMKKETLLC